MKDRYEYVYNCPAKQVFVINKWEGLKRYPRHDYECVLLVLKPREGTRVRVLPTGTVEFMPSWDEVKALVTAMDPEAGRRLPATLKNKPVERKARFDKFNARRHGRSK